MTIEKLPIPGCKNLDLFICPISKGNRATRRQRESKAVISLVRHVFGPDAEYRHHPDGSPFVAGSHRRISISHCGDYAALLVEAASDHSSMDNGCDASHPHKIGVDIEQMRPAQLRRVANRILTPNEIELLRSDEDLLWAWTAKEAVYKAAGIKSLTGSEISVGRSYNDSASAAGMQFKLSSFRTVDFLIVVALLTMKND